MYQPTSSGVLLQSTACLRTLRIAALLRHQPCWPQPSRPEPCWPQPSQPETCWPHHLDLNPADITISTWALLTSAISTWALLTSPSWPESFWPHHLDLSPSDLSHLNLTLLTSTSRPEPFWPQPSPPEPCWPHLRPADLSPADKFLPTLVFPILATSTETLHSLASWHGHVQ
jgi:hypothetical protein